MRPSALCLVASLYFTAVGSAVSQTEFAAPGLACRVWQIDDGLPDNSVASLLQTRDGFLWLGTYDGFVRFDGRRFVAVRLPGDKSLLTEGILLLHEDPRGQLWGVTDQGRIFAVKNGSAQFVAEDARFAGRSVSLHDDSSGNLWIVHYTGLLGRVSPDGAFSLVRNDVAAAATQSDGTLWVLTKQGSVFRQVDTAGTRVVAREGFENSDCRALAAGPGGEVLVARGDELWELGGDRPRLIGAGTEFAGVSDIYIGSQNAVWLHQGRHFRLLGANGAWRSQQLDAGISWVQSFRADRDGSLWLGEMGGGLVRLSAAGEVRRYRAGEGLNSNRISSLELDREGNLWIGFFDAGLQQARRTFFESVRYGAPLAPTSITEDSSGGIWIAGHGGTLVRWDGTRCRPVTFTDTTLPVQTRVTLCDKKDQLWAGTFNQGLWKYEAGAMQRVLPENTLLRDPRALFEDSQGRLWIGTHSGALFLDRGTLHAAAAPWLAKQPKVCAFAENRAGDVWIATEGAGVLRWNNGKIHAFDSSGSLATATISLLFIDKHDALWIGTRDPGLRRWHAGTLAAVTPAHGLPDEQLLAVCNDDSGNLWFTSRRGIVRIKEQELQDCAEGRRERLQYLRFDKSDGLSTAQCMGGVQPSLWQARDGRIWVPTSREAVSFDPKHVHTNEQAPLLSLGEFLVNGIPVTTGTDVKRLGPGAERIEFHFSALSFAAPARVRHAHRLVGLERTWTDDSSNSHITYAHLPPGRYRLEIMAANEHGVWSSPQAALSFEILPHLWQKRWFQFAVVTGTVMASTMLGRQAVTRRWRRKLREAEQRHALERERARIARDIHDELGASLTRITLLSQDRATDSSAQRALEEIQSTAREVTRAMDEMVWAVNPQQDTVEGLITYLQRFAQRFLSTAGIRCRFDLPLEADPRQLGGVIRHQVFLAFKECLHNVVRHAKATEVQVRVVTVDDHLQLEIADDGCGITSPVPCAAQVDRISCGHGLRSMRERLAQIDGRCEVLPRNEGGTAVSFIVPLAPSKTAAATPTWFSPS